MRRELAGALPLVDRGVGALVDALRDNGRTWDETVLVVVSDNGAQVASGGSNCCCAAGDRREGGHRVPAFVCSPNAAGCPRAGAARHARPPTAADWAPSLVSGVLGAAWASPPGERPPHGVDLRAAAIRGEKGAADGGAAAVRSEVLHGVDYSTARTM